MSRRERPSPYALLPRLGQWLRRAEGKHEAQSESLPLRRDVVTLLTYVRDHKVVGTQATGNLPLKAVREVTAGFVKPPPLEQTIGDHTYRVRSEDDVWPLLFAHHLANSGGLLTLEPGRRWRLTPAGDEFLEASPLLQVWILLAGWWTRADWVIAYPFSGMGQGLPPHFKQVALTHLQALSVETRIPFEPFADNLIQATGLRWTSQDPTFHQTTLRGAVQNMVVRTLDHFEILEPEYQDKPLGKGTISELVAFQVTPWGRDLLESLTV